MSVLYNYVSLSILSVLEVYTSLNMRKIVWKMSCLERKTNVFVQGEWKIDHKKSLFCRHKTSIFPWDTAHAEFLLFLLFFQKYWQKIEKSAILMNSMFVKASHKLDITEQKSQNKITVQRGKITKSEHWVTKKTHLPYSIRM